METYNGRKLDKKGEYKWFPGTTVVSFVPAGPWKEALLAFQKAVSQSELGQHFAMLPAESLHCTIFGLITETRKGKPGGLDGMAPDEAEAEFRPMMVEERKNPTKLSFTFVKALLSEDMTTCSIELKPATAEDKAAVDKWRMRAATDMKMTYNPNYVFHVTLGYHKGTWKTGGPKHHYPILRQATQAFEKLGKLEVGPPKFTFYRDMKRFFEFPPIYGCNIELMGEIMNAK